MKGLWETITRIFEPKFFDCLYLDHQILIWEIQWGSGVLVLGRNCSIAGSPLLCTNSTLVILLCSTPPLLSIAMCTALYSVFSSAPPPFLPSWPVDPQTNEQDSHFLHPIQCFSPWKLFYILHRMSFSKFNAILFYWKLFMFCFKLQYNHTRRLASAKKLLSYNNKNIIYCILTTVHILFV